MKTKNPNTLSSDIRLRTLFPEKYRIRKKAQYLPKNEGFVNHHWSYSFDNWADIIVLSKKDHKKVHKYMTYVQEAMVYKSKITGELLDTREKHLEHVETVKNLI